MLVDIKNDNDKKIFRKTMFFNDLKSLNKNTFSKKVRQLIFFFYIEQCSFCVEYRSPGTQDLSKNCVIIFFFSFFVYY